MASTEKFCLKWNDFHRNIGSALQEIRYEREFFDVTLASEDEQIQAHKVILSACSPFFRTVLKKNKHEHPLVYLKGVKFTELLSVLNFMYNGEVNIAQDDLTSFLAVAEDLKIKGLSQNGESTAAEPFLPSEPSQGTQGFQASRTSSYTSQRGDFSSLPPTKRPYPSPPPTKRSRPNHVKPVNTVPSNNTKLYKDDVLVPVKNEPGFQSEEDVSAATVTQDESSSTLENKNRALTVDNTQDGGYGEEFPLEEYEGMDGMEEGDIQIDEGQDGQQMSNTEILRESREAFFRLVDPFMESTVGDNGKLWLCKGCGHNSRTKQHIMNHVEMKHSQGPGYSCPLCSVRVPSYQALHKHISRNHNSKRKSDMLGYPALPNSVVPVEYIEYAL